MMTKLKNVKKMVASLVAATVLLSGGIVFAQEGTSNNSDSAVNQTAQQAKFQRKSVRGEFRIQIKEKVAQIKANKQANQALHKQIKEKMQLLRAKVKDLRKNPDSLNAEKIADIKEKITMLRDSKMKLAQTFGRIGEEKLDIKLAKKNRDLAAALASLDKVIVIQQQRQDILKIINSDLDAILSSL